MKKDFITTGEAAKLLGISRIAVFKKIKAGQIKADKVGRYYFIDKNYLLPDAKRPLTKTNKSEVEKAVKKMVKEYAKTLILLGKE
jgi:excisionase family DNA binding protein